jgi:hypothetical protein
MALTADEIADLQRRCVAARQRFQELAVRSVPLAKLRERAERLGLPVGEEMAQVSEGDLAFAFDLAIYLAPPGRSRAIDRVARQHARLTTEAALVLNGLTRSWFSIFRVLGPHPETGLLLEDALLGGEVWVVDEVLAEGASEPGTVVATRLARVAGFAITCAVASVLEERLLAGFRAVIDRGEVEAADLAAEPRLAEACWMHALGFRVS